MSDAVLNVDAPAMNGNRDEQTTKYRYMKVDSFGPLEHVDCALCGPGETSLVTVEPAFGEDFRVVRCPRCALIFTNPRPTAAWKARFHDPACNAYVGADGRTPTCEPTAGRLPGFHRLCGFLKKRTRSGATLLDVGCATGFFVKTAKEYGFAATGCDSSEAVVAEGRKRFGVQLIDSPIEDIAVADETFDVITLLRVFEHFPDPLKVLGEAWRILKPGGLILVETLNHSPHYHMEKHFRFLVPVYKKITDSDGLPWRPYYHLYDWTPRTLLTAVQRAGFVGGRCHLPSGLGTTKPSGRLARVHRLCEMVGETLVRVGRGEFDYWPVLTLTAQKPR